TEGIEKKRPTLVRNVLEGGIRSLGRAVLRMAIPALAILLIIITCYGQTAATVIVTVYNESGVVILGAIVRVEQGASVAGTATTDAAGKAKLTGLSAGEYRITVIASEFEQQAEPFVIHDDRQDVEIDFPLISKLRHQESFDVIAEPETLGVQAASPA